MSSQCSNLHSFSVALLPLYSHDASSEIIPKTTTICFIFFLIAHFHAQSKMMVEKFQNFRQNLSCLRQGMTTSGLPCPTFSLCQAAPVACTVQMFTRRCSGVSACGVFFVPCPQASACFLNVYQVTVVTFQLVYCVDLFYIYCEYML